MLQVACSSAAPEPKSEAMAEPKVAEDLPTWCSGSQKPCLPTRDFASRLCHGQYAGAALFLFQKQSPWQRRWVSVKAGLPARNSEGGPAGAPLVHAEELLVVAVDEPSSVADSEPKRSGSKRKDPELLALRWDGTCVSLRGSEAVTFLPGAPKHAPVDWSKLDPFVQRSLLREAEVERAFAVREQACSAKDSAECEKAERALSNAIVAQIRRGAKLSMPEQRP